jgi:hypothetical protein
MSVRLQVADHRRPRTGSATRRTALSRSHTTWVSAAQPERDRQQAQTGAHTKIPTIPHNLP